MKIRLLLLGSAVSGCLLSCRSAQAPAGSSSHPTAPPPHQVVLLSLDGAGAVELRRLYDRGKLKAGGFARFFRDGQVAEGLLPVDPSLTTTNHISLATGYAADRTGIVGNSFHPPGGTFNATANGFAAAIGTETLWEAARRQGKRVGVLTWPGADDSGPRRRGDWGMAYVNNPDRPPEMVTIAGAQWQPAEAMAKEHGIAGRSPVRGAEVEVAAGEPGAQRFDLLAVDQGLMVIPPGSPKGFPLTVGKWAEIPCRLTFKAKEAKEAKDARDAKEAKETPPRDAVCPLKLVALNPAGDTQVYFGGTYPMAAYPADFAAELAGRGLYWPGPPDDASLSAAWNGDKEIDLATWSEQSERFARFFGDTLVAAARRPDWDLLLGYIPTIDEAGHQLLLTDPRQPGYAARRDACAQARLLVWQAVDRELARLLSTLDLGTTTVVLVSDHGMSPTHTAVDPNGLLREQGLLAVDAKGKIRYDASAAYAIGSGGVGNLYLAAGRQELIPRIRQLLLDWKVGREAPVERVLSRREAAALALDHPNSGDLIVFFREGFGFRNLLKEGKLTAPTNTLGMHGYLNTHPSMRAIYLAVGAGVPRGKTGLVKNPEVAGRVAGWLGIEKPRPEAPVAAAPPAPPPIP